MFSRAGPKYSKKTSEPKKSEKDAPKVFLSPEFNQAASHDDIKSQSSLAHQSEPKSTQAFTYNSISNNMLNEKKALVLDLDETLVHASIEQISKYYMPLNVQLEESHCLMYIMKRPGLIDFLAELCDIYNIFVYTSADRTFVESVCEAVGISSYITEIHARDCFIGDKTRKTLKNITDIGLKPSHTILIDDSSKHVENQPDNAIQIKPFRGDNRDRELYYLLPFLKHIINLTEIRPAVTHLFDYFNSSKFKNKENNLLNYNCKMYNNLNFEGTAENCKTNKTQYSPFLCSLQSLKSKMADSLNSVASSNLIQSYPKKPMLIGKDFFNTDPSIYESTDRKASTKVASNPLQIWKSRQENDQKASFAHNVKIFSILQSSGES